MKVVEREKGNVGVQLTVVYPDGEWGRKQSMFFIFFLLILILRFTKN